MFSAPLREIKNVQKKVAMTFTAIDFETATGYRNSACAIGLVRVENGEIIDTFCSLIQPPGNEYWGGNIGVHGIRPADTRDAPTFEELFPRLNIKLNHHEALSDAVACAHLFLKS